MKCYCAENYLLCSGPHFADKKEDEINYAMKGVYRIRTHVFEH